MHVEFSYEDYLWLDIQKHLLELEELTTDVTFTKIVYKELMLPKHLDDIITSGKFTKEKVVTSQYGDYFEFAPNTDRFVLQQVLEVLKFIKASAKESIIDAPKKFYYGSLLRNTIQDSRKPNYFINKQTKVIPEAYAKKTVRVSKYSKSDIHTQQKPSTVISKA